MTGAVGKGVALLVLSAAVGGAGFGLFHAFAKADMVWRRARDFRAEKLDAAQDRLFGEAYMAAIRRIRAKVLPTETLYFIDDQSHEGGACYFALHHLAPRRVVLLGATRSKRLGRLAKRLPPTARWVVVVPDNGKAPELLSTAELLSRRDRARKARP